MTTLRFLGMMKDISFLSMITNNAELIILVSSLVIIILVCFIYKVSLRKNCSLLIMKKKNFRTFSWGILKGSLLAFFSLSIILLILMIFDLSFITFTESSRIILLFSLIVTIISAFSEELLFRSFLVDILRSLGTRKAIIIASLSFSIAHVFNLGYNFLAAVNLFLISIILCYFYIHDEHLGVPVGFHTSWNVIIYHILGFEVYGYAKPSLFSTRVISNNYIITGGAFGIEASILTTFSWAILLCLVVLIKKKQ